jgi:hypothetical protein
MPNTEDLLEKFLETPNFGGPAEIDVVVDNGQSGQRGSSFFLSTGNPNSASTPPLLSYPDLENPLDIEDQIGNLIKLFLRTANPQRYDVCIDINPISPTYLDLFYYYDGPQGLRWYDQIRLTPEGYPLNSNLDFDQNGMAVLKFPSVSAPPALTGIIANESISSNFNLNLFLSQLELLVAKSLNFQHNIVNENPVSPVIYPYGEKPVSVSYGLKANIVAGQTSVLLDSGNVLDIAIGEEFFKISGNGDFAAGAIVESIISPTEFSVSLPHETSGDVLFLVSRFSAIASTSTTQRRTITLTSGTTRDILIGQQLFKSSGSGEPGASAIVTRILSSTAFTVSSNTITPGSFSFGVSLPYIDVTVGFSALEFKDESWIPLTGSKMVHALVGITPIST